MSKLYKTDFYQWTRQQVDLLKKNKFRALDLENLIEEVDDLGQEKVNTLENHLTQSWFFCSNGRFGPSKKTCIP